jgi:zinc transport system ATP-binding protein
MKYHVKTRHALSQQNKMKKILEIKNLNAGYDNSIVLKNINFQVHETDFIGIIGPNGGGKTTLVKSILGVIKPLSGNILYHFPGKGRDFRKYIGYLPQQNVIDKKFPISVKEVILSGLTSQKPLLFRFSSEDKKKADELIEKSGLGTISRNPIGELSGGQLQRVFLARAVISNPRLLILDEPSTYVDNRSEFELYETLKELNKEIAILLVSHDIGTISSYIKTIACVNFNLHYHPSNEISSEELNIYNCPIDIIAHGDVPHRVLHDHQNFDTIKPKNK